MSVPVSSPTPLAASAAEAERLSGQDPYSGVLPCGRHQYWVEVELVGEDGVGVADQRYVLTLPDGGTRTGKTDSQGRIRFIGTSDQPPDRCTLSFPDLDGAAWESTE